MTFATPVASVRGTNTAAPEDSVFHSSYYNLYPYFYSIYYNNLENLFLPTVIY
jgi:hypothetical protein